MIGIGRGVGYAQYVGMICEQRHCDVLNAALRTSNGFSGSSATSATTDPSGNQVQDQYDDHGNVIREVKLMPDGSFVVTVSEYGYATADGATDEDGRPLVNVLMFIP